MVTDEFPDIQSVEVVPARAEPADVARIDHIASTERTPLEKVCYLVLIHLRRKPPVTSQGVELYLDDYRVARYWEFADGIYFKVYNPRFFEKHGGKRIRFSLAGSRELDTGFRLPDATELGTARAAVAGRTGDVLPGRLPLQRTVLRGASR